MKVLSIAPCPPDHDGIATYTEMICDELDRQGVEVRMIASHPARPDASEVLGVLGRPLDSPTVLVARAQAFGPDLVHLQFAVSTYGLRLISIIRLLDGLRRAGIPVVLTLHEITRDVETMAGFGRAIYRAIAARSDHIIVHTELALQACHHHLSAGSTVDVVAHPRARLPPSRVSAATLRARHGLGEERVLLSFGFIHVDKGIDDLLRALAQLEREGALDGVRLVIAGEVRRREGVLRPFEVRDRLYLRRLRAILEEERIGHRVLFTGYVPSEEVRPWFELASLVVLPYQRIEQSGAGSLASGAGAPLLTTTVGELEHLSTYPPVAPRDPVALADGLRAAMAKGGKGGSPIVDGSSDVDTVVRQTIQVYRSVLSRTRP